MDIFKVVIALGVMSLILFLLYLILKSEIKSEEKKKQNNLKNVNNYERNREINKYLDKTKTKKDVVDIDDEPKEKKKKEEVLIEDDLEDLEDLNDLNDLLGIKSDNHYEIDVSIENEIDKDKDVEKNLSIIYNNEDNDDYIFPKISYLKDDIVDENKQNEQIENVKKSADSIVEILGKHGIESKIEKCSTNQLITRYEITLNKAGNLSSEIINEFKTLFETDLIRVVQTSEKIINIEIPDKISFNIGIKNVINSNRFLSDVSKLNFVMGKEPNDYIIRDMGLYTNLLMVDVSDKCKKDCFDSIMLSSIYKSSPRNVQFVLIDNKTMDLNAYYHIPHLMFPATSDPYAAVEILQNVITEMQKRRTEIANGMYGDIIRYNKVKRNKGEKTMSNIVIIINEIINMLYLPHVEEMIRSLITDGKDVGIHLFIATQYYYFLNNKTLGNIENRIIYKGIPVEDSEAMVKTKDVTKLTNEGDFLYMEIYQKGRNLYRARNMHITDEEIKNITNSFFGI